MNKLIDYMIWLVVILIVGCVISWLTGCSNRPAPWVNPEQVKIIKAPVPDDCTYDHRTEETVCGNTIKL